MKEALIPDERGNTPPRLLAASAGLVFAMTMAGCWHIGNASHICSVATIRTPSLPEGMVGQPYSFSLEHNCLDDGFFSGPQWEVSDTLPPGMTFSSSGRFSGTPTQSGSFSLVVSLLVTPVFGINPPTVVDSRTFSLVVRPAP